MIKLIIFDLDNTLYPEAQYFYYLLIEAERKLDVKQKVDINIDSIESLVTRRHKDILSHIFKLFFLTDPSNEEHQILFDLYCDLKCELSLYQDAIEIIKELNKRKIQVALLSNGIFKVQNNKVKLLNLDKMVDKVFILDSKDYQKPHGKSFKSVLINFNVKPEEAIMVGDDPINDIEGAKKVGLRTYRVKKGFFKKDSSNADYEFDSLINLLEVIK